MGGIFRSNDGHGHLVKLPLDSRKALASAYSEAFGEMRKAIDRSLDTGPEPESNGALLLAGLEESEFLSSPTAAQDALQGLHIVARAALDHAQIAADAILDERASFGIVTLTRGSLEGFAKAWWLANAGDRNEFILRWLALRGRELKLRLKIASGETWMSNLTGQEVPLSDLHRAIEHDVAMLSAGAGYPVPSNTVLACEFGDQLGGSGRERYSQLSAVAHGESLGMEDFYGITTGTRRPHIVFGIPAWLSEYCAETCFISASLATRRVLEFVGADIGGRLGRAHDVALEVMKVERARNANITARSFLRFGSRS